MDPTHVGDAISAYAELVIDMEKMAKQLTNGVGKLMPRGWDCVVLSDPDRECFLLTISTPDAPGVPSQDFPNAVVVGLTQLPTTSIEDFKRFMQTLVEGACEEIESKIARQVAGKLLTAPAAPPKAAPKAGEWYQAEGRPRGPLSAGIIDRYEGPKNDRKRETLAGKAKDARDAEIAEMEALESIRSAVEDQP